MNGCCFKAQAGRRRRSALTWCARRWAASAALVQGADSTTHDRDAPTSTSQECFWALCGGRRPALQTGRNTASTLQGAPTPAIHWNQPLAAPPPRAEQPAEPCGRAVLSATASAPRRTSIPATLPGALQAAVGRARGMDGAALCFGHASRCLSSFSLARSACAAWRVADLEYCTSW